MTDPRIERLADLLVNYSCAVKPGENLLLEAIDVPHAFTAAVVKSAHGAGGRPFVLLKHNVVTRALMHAATQEQWQQAAAWHSWWAASASASSAAAAAAAPGQEQQ